MRKLGVPEAAVEKMLLRSVHPLTPVPFQVCLGDVPVVMFCTFHEVAPRPVLMSDVTLLT